MTFVALVCWPIFQHSVFGSFFSFGSLVLSSIIEGHWLIEVLVGLNSVVVDIYI